MIEINLIPDVKQELLHAQRMRSVVISVAIMTSMITVGIVIALALYVFGAQALRNSIYDSSIDNKSAELSEVDDLSKMLTIQNQLNVISTLQSNKKIDSRVFDMLAAIIPPEPNEATISQLSIDSESSTIRLEGQTASFDSMEIFKKTIDSAVIEYAADTAEADDGGSTSESDTSTTDKVQTKLASSISISDTSFGEDTDGNRTFRFVLSFIYPEELFSSSIDSVNFKLIVNGNVTDSYLGIPKTIFEEKAKDIEEGDE